MAAPKFTLKSGYTNKENEYRVILTYRAKGEKDFMRKTTGVFCRKGFLNNGIISDPILHPNIRNERQEILDTIMQRIKRIIKHFQEEEGIYEPEWRLVENRYEELFNSKDGLNDKPVPSPQEAKKLSPMESFQKFINDSASGIRRTKKGGKIAKDTVKNYRSTKLNLEKFAKHTGYKIDK